MRRAPAVWQTWAWGNLRRQSRVAAVLAQRHASFQNKLTFFMQTHTSSSPHRRRYLLGLVAASAALGGAGLAWHRFTPQALGSGAEEALWQLVFSDLQGAPLAMKTFQGRPLLLNFWATWCPPCVAELPLLNDFFKKNAVNGWQVLGLAVDQLAAVQRFLGQVPVSFPVALAGVSGIELARSLGNASGGLPFTVVLDANGAVAARKIGQLSEADLRRWSAKQP